MRGWKWAWTLTSWGTRFRAPLAVVAGTALLAGPCVLCTSVGAETLTLGKTSVGASKDIFAANRKRVSSYPLPTPGIVSQLSVYLEPSATAGQQVLEGVVYADSQGAPGALLGATNPITFASTQGAGWYALALPSALELPAGSYWLGVLTGASSGVVRYRYDKVAAARAVNQNTFTSGPSNPFGASSSDSQQMSLYAAYSPTGASSTPVNTSPPTISGAAQQGHTLTEHNGSWTNEPTGFSYQWLQCNSLGASCLPIAGATGSTYVPTAADVGHALAVQEIASNAAGPGAAATSAPTAVVAPPPPSNTSAPTINGTPQQGQTLTESHGTWTNEPTSFAYQWQQCDGAGGNCRAILGSTSQTYVLGAADVGHTIKVQESAINAGGSSAPASSAATATVTSQGTAATFGKTSVGALKDSGMFADYKIVHSATLSAPGSVTKLSVYAVPGLHATSPQSVKAAIYADSGGSPGALIATGSEVVYRGNVNGSGWLDLPLASPVALTPGVYWLGFITGAETEGMGYLYDKVASSRAYNANPYSSGPSNPFGSATRDSEQASIYATYTPGAASPPTNTSAPSISGKAQQGQTLSASNGSWSGAPTSFKYEWQLCDAAGASCKGIAGANANSYVLVAEDVGKTLRVAVTAKNEAGPSMPATSAQSEVVTALAAVSHLEYVLQHGLVSVYDADHEFKLLHTITLPQKFEVRGVSVAPSTHLMFVMYGGDGPGNGNGSVLAYDLVKEKPVWEVHLFTGIDSGQVSPDGTKLYVPSGEQNTTTGVWNVLSTSNGELIGTIKGGNGPHNTVVSNNGRYVYLGSRNYNFLDVYETEPGKIKEIGPLVGTVRPLTVNGSNTLAFTTATGFDGFQVSSVTTGKVLFTQSFAEFPKGFPFTTASHGISLSPDEKHLYVLDAVHKEVQFWDVSKVQEGVAPVQIGVVALAGLSGNESPCNYDCGRDGWVQLSSDGRYLYIGDSGEVIEAATRNVVATFPTLAQTKQSIEVDWQNGVPVATSGRTGVGYVE